MLKPLEYRDIARNKYIISDKGELYKINGKQIYGCNPKNENGYCRVTLVTINGKLKKYALHRLVLATFTYDSNLPVDHINCDKLCNELENLEYVTNTENSHRASNNGLYITGEKHHKAILNDELVHDICKLFEKGYNIRKVEKKLNLDKIEYIDKILCDILYRKSWKHISKKYEWDIKDIRFKTYKYKDLEKICKKILSNKYKSREIAKMFPNYDEDKLIQVIKKIKQGKLYKDIMEKVKRSTTIADEYGLIHIHRR